MSLMPATCEFYKLRATSSGHRKDGRTASTLALTLAVADGFFPRLIKIAVKMQEQATATTIQRSFLFFYFLSSSSSQRGRRERRRHPIVIIVNSQRVANRLSRLSFCLPFLD